MLALAAAAALLASSPAGARQHGHRLHRAVGACSASHAPVRAATIRRSRDATLCLLNRVRAQHGLPPLRLDARLSHAAGQHSREMVRRRYFGHDSANGRSPFDRMRATHYVPRNASWSLGENIGWGSGAFAEPIAMVRAWMHSPPHRANILSRTFRDIGIGIAPGAPLGGRGATYTTDFGRHS
ncbi:MAG: CAP domain-containing protein [Actinobacteria bacterium]|nr:CAP domain-containing protein [Actinomycetota bacterium]